jgi:hypothetical protein
MHTRKMCIHGGRNQANRVAVQSPTTDLLTPCLFESELAIYSVTIIMTSLEYSY